MRFTHAFHAFLASLASPASSAFHVPLAAVFLLLSIITPKASAQLKRTEPPFWFSGMHRSEAQIMFYGNDISGYDVSVSDNVPIIGVTRTENPNYQFVTIDTRNISPKTLTFTFSKSGKKTFTKPYEIRARRPGSSLRKGFDASDVIYLLMPDRFANGNPSNDSDANMPDKPARTEPFGRHGGDIQGIIDHLDYLKELGATTLWSTPLCEDNNKRASYHGYAQSDVYKIDPRYGTNDDYLRLSSELHKRGMKLVLDYVTNHWSTDHWMFHDLPTYTWLNQFPGYGQSSYRMTTQFDPYHSETDKHYCVDGWFSHSMPDLNQRNPLVLNYLIQNAIWWIEYAGLDGFRVDTYSYCDKEGISKWTKAIMDEYPHFNIAGEVWMHDQAQMAYWQADSKVGAIEGYNSHLPTVMDFTLHDAVEQAFAEDKPSWDKGIIKVYENFVNDFLYPNPNSILVFLENHDTQRFNQRYPDFRTYALGLSLIMTIRGIPEIYYGSEIGMGGDKGKGDGDIRRDFPGGWNGDTQNAFTDAGRTPEQKQYHDFTAKLLNWRKSKTVIHSGKTMHYLPENNVYVYFRYDETETVMVILNNSPEKQILKTARFAESTGSFTTGRDVLSEQLFDLAKDIAIDGKTPLILELH